MDLVLGDTGHRRLKALSILTSGIVWTSTQHVIRWPDRSAEGGNSKEARL